MEKTEKSQVQVWEDMGWMRSCSECKRSFPFFHDMNGEGSEQQYCALCQLKKLTDTNIIDLSSVAIDELQFVLSYALERHPLSDECSAWDMYGQATCNCEACVHERGRAEYACQREMARYEQIRQLVAWVNDTPEVYPEGTDIQVAEKPMRPWHEQVLDELDRYRQEVAQQLPQLRCSCGEPLLPFNVTFGEDDQQDQSPRRNATASMYDPEDYAAQEVVFAATLDDAQAYAGNSAPSTHDVLTETDTGTTRIKKGKHRVIKPQPSLAVR